MPKYGNFEIEPYVNEPKFYIGNFDFRVLNVLQIRPPGGGKTIYVQLLELWPLAKFYAQIWQF